MDGRDYLKILIRKRLILNQKRNQLSSSIFYLMFGYRKKEVESIDARLSEIEKQIDKILKFPHNEGITISKK